MKFFVGEIDGTLAVVREDGGAPWTNFDGPTLVDYVGSEDPEFWSDTASAWVALVQSVTLGGEVVWPKGWLTFGFSLRQLRHQLGNPHVTAGTIPVAPTALDLARHARNLHAGLSLLVGMAVGDAMIDRDGMRAFVAHREALARHAQRRADERIALRRVDVQRFRGNTQAALEAMEIARLIQCER